MCAAETSIIYIGYAYGGTHAAYNMRMVCNVRMYTHKAFIRSHTHVRTYTHKCDSTSEYESGKYSITLYSVAKRIESVPGEHLHNWI